MIRCGATLIELLVVLVILSLAAAVVGLALPGVHVGSVNATAVEIAAARRIAVDSSRAVSITVMTSAGARDVTAYPDGSVVADTDLHIDRFTGGETDVKAADASRP